MECATINSLTKHWDVITEEVIRFKKVNVEELQKLLTSTCEVLKIYSKDKLVPKELSGLLIEMKDFAWWAGDLEETPLHCLYQQIDSIISAINLSFLVTGFEDGKVEKLIEELNK